MVSFFGTDTSPSSGTSSPTIIRNSVVLPEPLGPTRPTFSPGLSWKEASTKRTCLPYCLLTLGERNHAAGSSLTRGSLQRDPQSAVSGRPEGLHYIGMKAVVLLESHVQLGAEQHRAIVVARRPFQRASRPTARRARPTTTRPLAVTDNRLREIEGVRRQQQRQLGDASRRHLHRVAAPRSDRRGRTGARARTAPCRGSARRRRTR